MKKFVSDAAILYGKESLVYNVYNLLHLAADVKKLGPLDNFSAFSFENKLGEQKSFVRQPQQSIQQVLRRLDEQAPFQVEKMKPTPGFVTKIEHTESPLIVYCILTKNGYDEFYKEFKHFSNKNLSGPKERNMREAKDVVIAKPPGRTILQTVPHRPTHLG